MAIKGEGSAAIEIFHDDETRTVNEAEFLIRVLLKELNSFLMLLGADVMDTDSRALFNPFQERHCQRVSVPRHDKVYGLGNDVVCCNKG